MSKELDRRIDNFIESLRGEIYAAMSNGKQGQFSPRELLGMRLERAEAGEKITVSLSGYLSIPAKGEVDLFAMKASVSMKAQTEMTEPQEVKRAEQPELGVKVDRVRVLAKTKEHDEDEPEGVDFKNVKNNG